MPMPADDAAGYRDRLLARTRRVQRGATVSAVVAAVGLSAGLAHALPGHQAPASKVSVPSRSGSRKAVPRTGHHHTAHSRRHHHHALQPPAQPPATAPASPAPVTSGGS